MSAPASLWSIPARAPGLSLVVAVGVSLVALLLARGLRPHYEIEDFFPRDTPERRAYERNQELFGRDDRMALVVVESPAPLGAEDLGRLHASAARITSLSGVERVLSPTTAQVVRRRADGNVVFEPALPPGSGAPSAGRLRELLATFALPPYQNTLLSADRRLAVLSVLLDARHLGHAERSRLLDELEAEQRRLEAEGYAVRLAGYPLHRVRLVRLSQGETLSFLPLTLLVIVLLGGLTFRSLAGALLPLGAALLGGLWLTGLLRVVGLPPNIFSPAVYVIVAVVGVADAVHILSRVRELRAAGLDPPAALARSLEEVGPSCFYATLTTAVAFASLALTGLPLVAHMGLQVALGVLCALAATFLLVPMALRVGRARHVSQEPSRLAAACLAVDAWAASRSKLVVAAFLTATLVGGALATQLSVNSPLLADLDEEHPIRQTHRLLEQRLGGVIPLDLLIEAPGEGGFSAYTPERMAKVERLTQRLRELPEVKWATGPVDPLRRLGPLLDRDSQGEVPRDEVPGLLPTALLLAGEQVAPWANVEHDVLRIRMRIADLDSDAAFELFAQIEGLYREILGDDPRGRLTGQGYLAQAINRDIVDHFRLGFLAALFAVCAVLLFVFRDPVLALASVLPNLFPVFVLAGLMSVFGLDLRYTTALVLSVAFGLAVDDTIHLLAQRGRQAPSDEGDAIHATLRVAGPGLVLTSILLAAGFGVLLAASFLPLRVMGLTLALTAGLALLADLLFLPALLRLMGRG